MSGNPDELRALLSLLIDEVVVNTHIASPASIIASILRTIHDELSEAEVDMLVVWKTVGRVIDSLSGYLENALKNVASVCSQVFMERVRITVLGGSRLTLSCLQALPPQSTVIIPEGYPERDGVWLYEQLRRSRGDLEVRLFPDVSYWQAVMESSVSVILLGGVDKSGGAMARAGSLAIASTAKRLGGKVLGLTLTLAVDPFRVVSSTRQTQVIGKVPLLPFDLFSIDEMLDGVITDVGLFTDAASLVSSSLKQLSGIIGDAVSAVLRETGLRLSQ